MKAIDRPFTKVVNGTTQFIIPVFQRDYSWGEEQCERLWEDVVRIGRQSGERGHFIGSLVYVPSGDTSASFTRWLLIDGQQRMTTVTLLLLALRKHLLETNWQPTGDDGPTPQKIEAYFLKNIMEQGERRHKLVLRRRDQEVLRALMEDTEAPANAGRVGENFDWFKKRVATEDPNVIYAGIGRLIVVDVTLDRTNDDPQLVFESLNSTGVDLNQADLIRNYILMRVSEPQQTSLYERYWSKIEELFRDAERIFDAFARDYMGLISRSSKQARGDAIYHEFREFFRKREDELGLEPALEEMLRFARYHAAFSLGRGATAHTAVPLARLNRLAEVAAILVMRLGDLHHRAGTLTESEFIEALALLESYVFRRSICGMQSRGYGQTFSALAARLKEDAPLTSLKVALHRLRETYRFPRDEEFTQHLQTRDVYAMRNVHYLLDRFENHGSKEPTVTATYTVEHVLPQNENLSKEWRDMLGADWQTVQRAWLHRLGNLTLTGYNSTYSDRPFSEKKTISGGFNESSVRLNKFIREQSAWTDVEIQKRGELLSTRAVEIWPRLSVNEESVRDAIQDELRTFAGRRSADSVAMSPGARQVFESLRPMVRGLSDGIIEVPEANSVAYHAADGDFFMEVLPRTHGLVLLLNLDFADCDHADAKLTDATYKKFVIHATNTGGVSYRVWTEEHLAGAMPYIHQAYEDAAK